MTKSIQVEESLLIDLKLIKRVLGTKSMTETIRALLIARGYNQEWFEYMTKTLETEGIETEIDYAPDDRGGNHY